VTKADIARIVYERHGGLSNREAARLVDIIFDSIKGTLGTGEKVVSSSVTLGNATYFNTNRPVPPAPGVCTTNLGEARQYTVSFLDGSAVVPYNVSAGLSAASRYQLHAGGGFLPSPVPVIAEIGGRLYQTVIVGTTALMPPTSPLQARIRTFWYRR